MKRGKLNEREPSSESLKRFPGPVFLAVAMQPNWCLWHEEHSGEQDQRKAGQNERQHVPKLPQKLRLAT